MSLFRDLGRRAEKLKAQATDAAESQADYECADCGKGIFTDRETCPNCGSETVVRREEPAADETSDADDTGENDAERT